MTPIPTIALLCREPGLLVLESLMNDKRINLKAVATLSHLPKGEGCGIRPELAEYQSMCRFRVPLLVMERRQAKTLDGLLHRGADLLVSLSWRAILPGEVLSRFRHAINIHRGELPRYAGAEPIRRALESGERRVAITAHRMVEECDAGDEVARVWHDVDGESDPETVKRAMYQLYAPLVQAAISAVTIERPKPAELPPTVERDPTWDGVLVVD